MTDYVELHARSAFSFLEGASMPEFLMQQAAASGDAGDGAARPQRSSTERRAFTWKDTSAGCERTSAQRLR